MTKRRSLAVAVVHSCVCCALFVAAVVCLHGVSAIAPANAASQPPADLAADPTARYGHTLAAIAGKGYLFGGKATGEPLNDLWLWDGGWRELAPATRPQGRVHHAAAVVGNTMYVFFGQGAGGALLDDVWAFDATARTWRQAASPAVRPQPRYGHSAVAIGSDIFIFGGVTAAGRADDCVWRFRTATGQWQQGACIGQGSVAAGHVAANVNGEMLVYGGRTSFGLLWRYNPHTDAWSQATVLDPGYAPRANSAVAVRDNRMWLFGGDIEGFGPTTNILQFTVPADGGQITLAPLPCMAVARSDAQAAVVTAGSGGGIALTSVLIFGGMGASQLLADSSIYWIGPAVSSPTPTPPPTPSPAVTPLLTATPSPTPTRTPPTSATPVEIHSMNWRIALPIVLIATP